MGGRFRRHVTRYICAIQRCTHHDQRTGKILFILINVLSCSSLLLLHYYLCIVLLLLLIICVNPFQRALESQENEEAAGKGLEKLVQQFHSSYSYQQESINLNRSGTKDMILFNIHLYADVYMYLPVQIIVVYIYNIHSLYYYTTVLSFLYRTFRPTTSTSTGHVLCPGGGWQRVGGRGLRSGLLHSAAVPPAAGGGLLLAVCRGGA